MLGLARRGAYRFAAGLASYPQVVLRHGQFSTGVAAQNDRISVEDGIWVFGSDDFAHGTTWCDGSGDTGKARIWLRLLATRAFRVLPPVGWVPVSLPAGDCGVFSLLTAYLLLEVGEIPRIKTVVLMFGTGVPGITGS